MTEEGIGCKSPVATPTTPPEPLTPAPHSVWVQSPAPWSGSEQRLKIRAKGQTRRGGTQEGHGFSCLETPGEKQDGPVESEGKLGPMPATQLHESFTQCVCVCSLS